MGEIRQLVISRALRRMRHGWVLTRGIGNQRQELRSGCHCWLVQQCGAKRRYALLDEPAVAPDTFFTSRNGTESVPYRDPLPAATRPRPISAPTRPATRRSASFPWPSTSGWRCPPAAGNRKRGSPCRSPNTSIEVRSSTICTCNVPPTTSNGALRSMSVSVFCFTS